MRLSEAVLLGSTLIKLDPHYWLDQCFGGCLIGMAMAAEGYQHSDASPAIKKWPWLEQLEPAKGDWEWEWSLSVLSKISRLAYRVWNRDLTLEAAIMEIRALEDRFDPIPAAKPKVRKVKHAVRKRERLIA